MNRAVCEPPAANETFTSPGPGWPWPHSAQRGRRPRPPHTHTLGCFFFQEEKNRIYAPKKKNNMKNYSLAQQKAYFQETGFKRKFWTS